MNRLQTLPVSMLGSILVVQVEKWIPLSLGRGVEIQINYGNRGEYLVIDGVHFVGRASAIQIDENVIVEEYSFLHASYAALQC